MAGYVIDGASDPILRELAALSVQKAELIQEILSIRSSLADSRHLRRVCSTESEILGEIALWRCKAQLSFKSAPKIGSIWGFWNNISMIILSYRCEYLLNGH